MNKYKNYVHVLWPHADFYRTHEVKADSIAIMDAFGMYNPIELAHPDMTIRALAILARLGIEADPLIESVPYDTRSAQFQTRNKVYMAGHELAARGEHVLRKRVQLL